jgi:hypothetical protein
VFVLDESVLYRLIGSPAIMAAQLAHIAGMSERPNVSIHILPSANGANAGLFGAFSRLLVEGEPELLHTEAVEDQLTRDRALIRKADIVFELVRRDALPRVQSRAVILEAADQWKSR